jgi:MerR family transcriptional regulator, light-induced transcriptional regulator
MAYRPPSPQYPIRAVARMTGLSVDTLRAWERRYEAVVPGRGDRGRVYSETDVARLKQLSELVKRGHAIGTIAGLPTADLDGLLDGADALADQPAVPDVVADLGPLTSALDRYDLDAIETALNRYAVVLPPRDLVFAVILPLLQQVGRRWEEGTLRPAQEHLVSAIVRSVLGGLLRATVRPLASPRIVFATPAGERHELGLLCAALLTAAAGYGVLYLGPDLPASDIAHAAITAGARAVMISLTAPGAAARGEIKTLAGALPGVELWIGGPGARSILTAIGDRGRLVEGLSDVVPMLARHAR